MVKLLCLLFFLAPSGSGHLLIKNIFLDPLVVVVKRSRKSIDFISRPLVVVNFVFSPPSSGILLIQNVFLAP